MKSSADVLCLQEVELPLHQQEVYKAVRSKFPYIVSAIDLEQNVSVNVTPACDAADLQTALSCSETECNNVTGLDFTHCFLQQCYSILNSLPNECLFCVFIGGHTFECMEDPSSLYQQTYGIMLLSKFELSDTRLWSFTPEGNDHGAYVAYIQTNVG